MFYRRMLGQMCFGLALLAALPAHAEWKQAFTPYIWLVDLETTVGESGSATTSKMDFYDDLLPIVDAAWMHMYEARQDNWSIMNDVLYMKISDGVSKTASLGALTANASANVSFEEMLVDVMAGYTPDNSTTTFYAGLRYIRLDADATFKVAVPAGAFARNGSRDEDWVDPVIGVRHVFSLSRQWNATLQADVGGGVDSEFSSLSTVTLDYAVTDDVTFRAGYRYARVDRDDSDLVFDQTIEGFLLAAKFGF